MLLIQDSKDLLYIVLAFCALWLTIFLAWFIYYLAMILRQFYLMVRNMRARIDKLDKAIKEFKSKLENGAACANLIGEGLKRAMEIIRKHQEKKRRKSKIHNS